MINSTNAISLGRGGHGGSPLQLRPLLKWAGGKRWLVSHLKPIWEARAQRRYVEPFCGGLAVVLGLQPKQALLNDINPHLINFYRHVQDGLRMRVRMRNDEDLFYRQRERFNNLIRRGKAHTAAWPRKILPAATGNSCRRRSSFECNSAIVIGSC